MVVSNYWKFVKKENAVYEKVLDREHHWHFNAEVSRQASNYMVKVVIPIGSKHDFHRHPEMDEILYVLKGTVEQWVEGEMQVMEAGDSVYIERNVVHGTFNIGDDDLEVLAILGPSEGWEAGTIDESGAMPYSGYRQEKS